jgi:ferredoxin
LSEPVEIDKSRRDFLTWIFKPAAPDESDSPALPDGVNITLLRDRCIAWGKGICDRCDQVCQENALLFVGLMSPSVIESRCTYCRLCVSACPVDAILVRPDAIDERGEEQI